MQDLPRRPLLQYQPAQMEDLVTAVNSLTYIVLGSGIGAAILIAALQVASYKVDWFRRRVNFQLLDRFFDSHHELWTRPAVTHLRDREKWKEFYIFAWPTHMGGFFSLLFFVISLTTALFLGLPFKFGNVVESRSLVPNIAMTLTQVCARAWQRSC